MVQRVFEWLFVLSLVAPAVTIILGVLLLLKPSHIHRAKHASGATFPA